MILVLRYYNQVTSENVLTLPPTVFPGVAAGKVITCDTGDLGSIPGLGRPPGEGKGCPLQYSGLENFMNFILHGVAKSWTRLSDFHLELLT